MVKKGFVNNVFNHVSLTLLIVLFLVLTLSTLTRLDEKIIWITRLGENEAELEKQMTNRWADELEAYGFFPAILDPKELDPGESYVPRNLIISGDISPNTGFAQMVVDPYFEFVMSTGTEQEIHYLADSTDTKFILVFIRESDNWKTVDISDCPVVTCTPENIARAEEVLSEVSQYLGVFTVRVHPADWTNWVFGKPYPLTVWEEPFFLEEKLDWFLFNLLLGSDKVENWQIQPIFDNELNT